MWKLWGHKQKKNPELIWWTPGTFFSLVESSTGASVSHRDGYGRLTTTDTTDINGNPFIGTQSQQKDETELHELDEEEIDETSDSNDEEDELDEDEYEGKLLKLVFQCWV